MVTLSEAMGFIIEANRRAQQISMLVQQAQNEGRGRLTTAEWQAITKEDDAARQALVDAIAKAKAEGR